MKVEIDAIELENIKDNLESFANILELCFKEMGYRSELEREIKYIDYIKESSKLELPKDNLVYTVDYETFINNIVMFAISTNKLLQEKANIFDIDPYLYDDVCNNASFNKQLLEELLESIKLQIQGLSDDRLIKLLNNAEVYINSITIPMDLLVI